MLSNADPYADDCGAEREKEEGLRFCAQGGKSARISETVMTGIPAVFEPIRLQAVGENGWRMMMAISISILFAFRPQRAVQGRARVTQLVRHAYPPTRFCAMGNEQGYPTGMIMISMIPYALGHETLVLSRSRSDPGNENIPFLVCVVPYLVFFDDLIAGGVLCPS